MKSKPDHHLGSGWFQQEAAAFPGPDSRQVHKASCVSATAEGLDIRVSPSWKRRLETLIHAPTISPGTGL